MPEGWQTVPIGNVLVSAQYGLNLPVKPDGVMPIIGMKDMIAGHVENSGWGCVDLNKDDEARYLLRKGDILLNRTNSPDLVGKVALWNRPERAVFPSYIVRFRADDSQADAAFLNYVLNSIDGQTRLKALSTRGVSQANINPTTFRQAFTLNLPQIAEQRRIVAVLSVWDDAIATAERLIISRSLLLSGHAREVFLPVFASTPLQGCTTIRLGNLFDEREERGGVGRLLSVTGDRGIIDRDDLGRKDTSNNDKTAYKRVKVGDIAYNTMRMWQGVSALSTMDGLVSPAYTVIVPRSNVDGVYAAFLFKQQHMIDRFWRYSQGLVDDTLNLKFPHFSEVTINLPAIDQQRRDVNALTLFAQATSAAVELTTLLRRQKRGLMQKLLTGEWRVPATGDAFVPGGSVADRLEAAE